MPAARARADSPFALRHDDGRPGGAGTPEVVTCQRKRMKELNWLVAVPTEVVRWL